jgi:2-polyprenyl-3-methyl-5-hydroxy-6-metoxy-1,4-benzoquinol methylase
MVSQSDDHVSVNVRFWDALADAHGRGSDAYYDVEALVAGRSSLSDVEETAVRESVGDVNGLDVLHVQCHLGMDAVSMARRGARVTGIDFSPVALRRAADIAAACGVQVDYVEADSTALPPSLQARFDLAYATIGVLCWIADLDAWMRSVRSTLRPGGRLVVVDLHPMLVMVESTEPLRFDMPYAFDGSHEFVEPESYAGVGTAGDGRNVNYAHSLGEVVSAAVRAGLRLEALVEHLDAPFDPRGDVLAREDDGRFRLRVTGQPLPVLFTLLASYPGELLRPADPRHG